MAILENQNKLSSFPSALEKNSADDDGSGQH
jgi:hypothetical protein